MDPNAFSDDDSFDELKQQLPKYQASLTRSPNAKKVARKLSDDVYQTWLIERFNRTGPLPISEMIIAACRQISGQFRFVVYTYIFDIFSIFVFYQFTRSKVLLYITSSLYSTFSFCIAMSNRYGLTLLQGMQKIKTPEGLFSVVLAFIGNAIRGYLLYLGKIRSSSITFCAFMYIFYQIFVFFVPCLAFDVKQISTFKIIKFIPKILFQQNVIFYTFFITVVCELCDIIAPFTLGIPFWVSLNLKNIFFESVCGSAARL